MTQEHLIHCLSLKNNNSTFKYDDIFGTNVKKQEIAIVALETLLEKRKIILEEIEKKQSLPNL